MARCLNNIGDTYRSQGRYDEALALLHKSLKLREQNRDRGGMMLSLNNLSRLYQDQGKYQEMLDTSRRSAKLAEEINAREELWTAQEHTGRALFALGQPAEARTNLLAAIAGIESLRREVAGGEQQQQSFLENRLSPWLAMIDLLVSQGKFAEALTFAEQSKARVLLDALQTGRANLRLSRSKEERDSEEQQRLKLVALNSQLTAELRRDKPDVARVNELKAGVEKARIDYEDIETRLYVSHPELKVQRGEAPTIKA
jgi:tetratricopeptide (TPR) repeat protein